MCGFAGFFARGNKRPEINQVLLMSAALENRGPDAIGVTIDEKIGLIHHRLKIIDLSNRSNQPFVDTNLGLSIAFNGCIYNHIELKQELLAKGYHFRTQGDTEVLLKAWDAWGAEALPKLRGMFSFCIHHHTDDKMILCRDHFGMKPLYYLDGKDGVYFSSSLDSFLKLEDFSAELDPFAVHHYFSMNSIVPSPMTIFKKVKKVPPSAFLVISGDGNIDIKNFIWHQDDNNDIHLLRDPEERERELSRLLFQSCRRHIVSDVGGAILLSGGLDSALLTAMLSEISSKQLTTYSVGFEDFQGEVGSEFQYSDRVSNLFGTRHEKLLITESDIINNLPSMFSAMSEPMVSHDIMGYFCLAKLVSENHKVAISGQGADELFAGYHWYPRMLNAKDPVSSYSEAFFDNDDDVLRRRLNPGFLPKVDASKRLVAEFFTGCEDQDPVKIALRLDQDVMMIDDPIKRVDNMMMAFGVEGRIPFLDVDVAVFSRKLTVDDLLARGGKGILKQVASKYLPEEIVFRDKAYFPVPKLKHLRSDILTFATDVLNSQKARDRAIMKKEFVDGLLSGPSEHIGKLGASELWKLATLEYWLQQRV